MKEEPGGGDRQCDFIHGKLAPESFQDGFLRLALFLPVETRVDLIKPEIIDGDEHRLRNGHRHEPNASDHTKPECPPRREKFANLQ